MLVNNAGVYKFAPLEGDQRGEFHRQFNINVLGTILATKEAVKHFGPKGGSVINVSSIASAGVADAAIYSGTKGAVDAITRARCGVGAAKIRVNAIAPGGVETEGTHSAGIMGSEFEKEMIGGTPLGRIGQPDDIARVAVFLASDDSAWVTGERLTASGGFDNLAARPPQSSRRRAPHGHFRSRRTPAEVVEPMIERLPPTTTRPTRSQSCCSSMTARFMVTIGFYPDGRPGEVFSHPTSSRSAVSAGRTSE